MALSFHGVHARAPRETRRGVRHAVFAARGSPPERGCADFVSSPRGDAARNAVSVGASLARAPAGTRRLRGHLCVCADQRRRAPRPARVRVRHRVADAHGIPKLILARHATREEFLFERPRGGRAGRRSAAGRSSVRLEVGVRNDDEREREDGRDTEYAFETHSLGTPSEVRRRFEGTVSPSRVKTFRLRTFFASGARTGKRRVSFRLRLLRLLGLSRSRGDGFRLARNFCFRRGVRAAGALVRGHHR